nr:oligosaccharide flippase family protein [Deltaproteobacteria bacterium]
IQYLAPLIVLPYLVRVIGPAKFGIISFAQAIAYYFALLPDIGTNLYAPREIALIKDNRDILSKFVAGILVLKALVLLVTLILYFLVITFVQKFHAEALVFIFSAGYIIGESFIPVWFFQGLEKMVNITIGVFIIRVLALISIFIFIQQPDDYLYVPLINSGALIIGVVFMYGLIFFREGIKIISPDSDLLRRITRDSFPLFVSNLVRNLHTGLNIAVLGFFTSNTIVGYYSAAERLIKAGLGLLTQLSNVFYPYISRMLKVSREAGSISMRTGFVAGMILSIPAAIFVISYSEFIVYVMLGNEFTQSILPLRILGTLFLIIGFSNIFGVQVLLPLGKRQVYMRAILGGFIVHLILVLLLTPWLFEVGAALAFVIAQVVVSFWMGFVVKKLSLGLVSGSAGVKIACLALGLGVFSFMAWILDFNSIISMGIFCVLYISLVLALRIVDTRSWSIAA